MSEGVVEVTMTEEAASDYLSRVVQYVSNLPPVGKVLLAVLVANVGPLLALLVGHVFSAVEMAHDSTVGTLLFAWNLLLFVSLMPVGILFGLWGSRSWFLPLIPLTCTSWLATAAVVLWVLPELRQLRPFATDGSHGGMTLGNILLEMHAFWVIPATWVGVWIGRRIARNATEGEGCEASEA
ncbi:MAG: hypothetical protein AUJ92_02120 [Armatimonadetes bacterium CG2_30_59_28]|nr:hypothetical protein [Armatimonadota bacterium]OIO98117.1 MAG: hypothetical protein AUJ92_02120 [Armatimonadetes bacterium CG2_30_59_28]PIU63592.1 MAG: hypothetical protein COS85_15585 [Armatimonadetes bacterium CG07_land_8_20_14_0_80_59_28]PIX42496.1 MAG: hypothetical protein COZ56_09180 [Armatimonadetes bacterium CG_4_8_14_3_um_filter_58_9]PIY42420.1 MAG: hypothetical protein COZ05_13950 [Armatimonadetes bacterium CG_4_10_14_3_um_filter_59_10]